MQLGGRPFFVVGSPRSGTTLLRFMLSSHPRLYIPEETGFIPFLRQPPQAELSRKQVGRMLTRIGQLNRHWRNLIEDPRSFYDSLPDHRAGTVLDALFRARMKKQGGERWGDKTPGYVRYIPALRAVFPDAQIIHLIRDGRDATLSALEKWGRTRWYMDSYYLMASWRRNVRAARGAGRALGQGDYCELRYEELVVDPERLMRRICRFLDETFSERMLNHGKHAPGDSGSEVAADVRGPVTEASTGRWRTEMSGFQLKLADAVAGRELVECGYELSDAGPFDAEEIVRFISMACKYGAAKTLRSLLYRAGALTLNRGMRP